MRGHYRPRNESERVELTMGKQLYSMKRGNISVLAKSKYEALYKISVMAGRVIDWTEVEKKTAYIPREAERALQDISNKGVLVKV